jgi:uncharacterized phiE125 gp8 family phage protein
MKHNVGCDLVHSLVSLGEAKSLLGLDDREDSLVGFLLVSSTYAIEEYCMRRLLRKRIKERFVDTAEPVFPLREYPVAEVSAVEGVNAYGASTPFFYDLAPEAGSLSNIPHTLRIFPARGGCALKTVNVKYIAGWRVSDIPPDLKEACLELTAWKYARHNNRFTYTANNKKEANFENKTPERVKELLEPYKRRVL